MKSGLTVAVAALGTLLTLSTIAVVFWGVPQVVWFHSDYADKALLGKTETEVTKILGEPCDDSRYGASPPFRDPVTITYFHGGDFGIIVEFNKGRATKISREPFGSL